MENNDTTYCYFCNNNSASCDRVVRLLQQNGYKLTDFKVKLCTRCNCLSNEALSYYFSVSGDK